MIQVNSIGVLKISGEKVFVLGITYDGQHTNCEVRRGSLETSGASHYFTETYRIEELSTIDEFAEQIVDEMIRKTKAQKRLLKVERQVEEDAELELAEPNPPADPTPRAN